MVGEKDKVVDSGDLGLGQPLSNRKLYWRSASWSSSRTSLQNTETAVDNDSVELDPNGGVGNGDGSVSGRNNNNRRFPVPLTPRSQQSLKGRSCLPPLQPLSIARRSLDEWPKAGSDDIGEWLQPSTPRGDGNRSGERLKLDLSGIQHNPENSGGGLVRRDKIAFFDKQCSKVAEHIYFGGDAVARDKAILKKNGITHILNCAGYVCPEYLKADFKYRTLWLQDSPSEDITCILYDVFDYFEDVREQGGRVFVHCCQGVSRSTSLVIAYRMWREGQSFDDAFQYVKAARGIADPNMGFACQLLQCQKRVHAFPLSPSSLLRLYRIAPQSAYDPLHLVPKMLNEPSPASLDSRGAFILHVPSVIYVWIGKFCDIIMERDARGAVNQIVRYEKVQGPIIMIKDGDEPPNFWDAFSNFLPLMDKSIKQAGGKPSGEICTGVRKVDSYNVDFENFQKAISGGVAPSVASSETGHETCLPARESSWSVLRRKFASGNMKEFVSPSKLSLSRIYPDPVVVGLDNYVSNPSSSSASSPSLSPSSFSTSSSSPPNLSSDFISSFCQSSSLSLPSPTKRSPVSLAERRSSMSKSLKLPSMAKDTRPTDGPTIPNLNRENSLNSNIMCSSPLPLAERRGGFLKSFKLPVIACDNMVSTGGTRVLGSQITPTLSEEDRVKLRADSQTCSLREAANNYYTMELHDGSEKGEIDFSQQCDLQISIPTKASDNSCGEETEVAHISDKSKMNNDLEVSRNASSFSKKETTSVQSNPVQLLIHRWPSLEKIDAFGRSDIKSESAYIFIAQDNGLCKNEHRVLYFWFGRSFSYDKSRMPLECNRWVNDTEEIDWNRVGCDILSQMGLPEGITIKIVKEDEEPAELLAMLSSL